MYRAHRNLINEKQWKSKGHILFRVIGMYRARFPFTQTKLYTIVKLSELNY
ncbi:hypothetical protein bcgnr5380_39920 [Bacillus cereus]